MSAELFSPYLSSEHYAVAHPRAVKATRDWITSRGEIWSQDFAELARYRSENAELKTRGISPNTVFIGDSITDMWALEQQFGDYAVANRGIGGQTSSQLLLRFRQDVIALKPRQMILLVGTNDLAGNTGPMSQEAIMDNICSMAELAQCHHIQPILCSLLPVHCYSNQAWDNFLLRAPARITQLNAAIQEYCQTRNIPYIDYFSAMVDENGLLTASYSDDGLHPNALGYRRMESVLTSYLG
jgi:acyl-CoA thioesterase I